MGGGGGGEDAPVATPLATGLDPDVVVRKYFQLLLYYLAFVTKRQLIERVYNFIPVNNMTRVFRSPFCVTSMIFLICTSRSLAIQQQVTDILTPEPWKIREADVSRFSPTSKDCVDLLGCVASGKK